MLGVDQLYPEDYLRHVSMGPSEVSTKSRSRVEIREVRYPADELTFALPPLATVKSDTFRTLATDTQFKGKVKEDMLVRLLDAFVWKNKDRGGSETVLLAVVSR